MHDTSCTADRALDKIGFGRFQVRLVLATSLFWAVDSMQLLLLVFLVPILRCEWSLSTSQEAGLVMVNSNAKQTARAQMNLLTRCIARPLHSTPLLQIVFVSMAIGSVLWGNFADRAGRRLALIGTCALNVVAGICSAAAPSYMFMLVSQCLVGVAVGGCPVAVTLYGECLPPSK